VGDPASSRRKRQRSTTAEGPLGPNDWAIDDDRAGSHEQGRYSQSLIASFASGITKDIAAVHAALVQPWSNGQTEGHITKLKLVKRQMYGRAKIDLLQARLIGTTAEVWPLQSDNNQYLSEPIGVRTPRRFAASKARTKQISAIIAPI
jgi:hypothetical protein